MHNPQFSCEFVICDSPSSNLPKKCLKHFGGDPIPCSPCKPQLGCFASIGYRLIISHCATGFFLSISRYKGEIYIVTAAIIFSLQPSLKNVSLKSDSSKCHWWKVLAKNILFRNRDMLWCKFPIHVFKLCLIQGFKAPFKPELFTFCLFVLFWQFFPFIEKRFFSHTYILIIFPTSTLSSSSPPPLSSRSTSFLSFIIKQKVYKRQQSIMQNKIL